MVSTFILLLILLVTNVSWAFQSHSCRRQLSAQASRLFGMSEWREKVASTNTQEVGTPILLLPFSAKEALVPGQSTSIILKEGRFYDLFQDCIDDYESIVGMVLMGDDGLLREMPLCEIHDFDVQAGFRGKVTVSVTLLAVARAQIVEVTAMKPIMTGVCTELSDKDVCNVALANEFVDDIESIIKDMNRIVGGVSPKQRYEDALELAFTSGDRETTDGSFIADERTISELTAASWAVFTLLSDKSFLYKAIATTSVTDRLKIGLKALLDAKYETSAIPDERDNDVGFE